MNAHELKRLLVKPLRHYPPVLRVLIAPARFGLHIWRTWDDRRGFRLASALAFESLFAIVPMAALVVWAFAILKSRNAVEPLMRFVGSEFMPSFGPRAVQLILALADRVSGSVLGPVSAILTVGFSILLFLSAERSINDLWNTGEDERPIISQFASYWTFVSILPLVSVAVMVRVKLSILPPAVVSSLALFLFFFLVNLLMPVVRVNSFFAAIGAAVAVPLFQIARWAFSMFMSRKYFAIYGELGITFLLMLWLYYLWLVVLASSVITYTLQRFTFLEYELIRFTSRAIDPEEPMVWRAWEILTILGEEKKPVDSETLALRLGDSPAAVDLISARLLDSGLLFKTALGWTLARTPDSITLAEVYLAFSIPVKKASLAIRELEVTLDKFFEMCERITLSQTLDERKRLDDGISQEPGDGSSDDSAASESAEDVSSGQVATYPSDVGQPDSDDDPTEDTDPSGTPLLSEED